MKQPRVIDARSIKTELGEGPIWVVRDQALYFVDIYGCRIHRRHDTGDHQTWPTSNNVGFIFPLARPGPVEGHEPAEWQSTFICGMRRGLYDFSTTKQSFRLLTPVEADRPKHRINDGHVDATGRLWFGTMHEDCQTVGGALYSWRSDEGFRLRDNDYIITNGPATSPDGRKLHHTDSATGIVYTFELSEEGMLSHKRPFIRFEDNVYPDGMAVDEAGNIWIALFNGWRVEQYSQEGEKLDEIRFPCANITKPAFGGADLRTLYLTSAWTSLTPEQLAKQPQAGSLFGVDVEIPGLAANEVR